jgi:alkylation response protein AidB-like acyl-CoA dehydrogenase
VDFSLTDDQQLLRDTARRLLRDQCPPALVRAHVDDRDAYRPLWLHLREFAALGVGDCTDLCLFLEEVGYAAAPGPFLASVAFAAPLLDAAGAPHLDAVLAGERSATVAIAGARGLWEPNEEARKLFVPDADIVDDVVVVGAEWAIAVVPRMDCTLTRIESVGFSRPLFAVEIPGSVAATATLDAAAGAAWLDRVHTAAAAELVGTARHLFEMSLQYAKERVQFDRPIGSFQAIQHKLAEMSLALERSIAAVQYAAMTVDAADADRARAAHAAKAAASVAAHRMVKDSAQIHGGIGYTWEHDLQLFIRHALLGETQLGTAEWHHDRLADLLFN